MRIPGKRRVLLAAGTAATLGAVATLVSGVTFGLFSSSEAGGTNTFTAGTVSVGLDTPASVTCTIGTGATATVTGDLTSGSATVNNVATAPTAGQYVGWSISDTTHSSYIPAGTTVLTSPGGGVLTMSNNATTTVVGDTLHLAAPSAMVPGDSSKGAASGSNSYPTCSYNVSYTGSAPAWIGVDVAVANGTPALFSSGSDTGIQFYLADANNTYLTSTATNTHTPGDGGTAGTTYAAQTTGTATALLATGISDLLVNPGGATPTAVANGAVSDMSLDYLLPLGSGNAFQTGSVTVTLTFHAVQATNNALPAGCQSGWQCPGATFWS